MPLLELTEENFDQLIDSHELAIVDFWAPWCAPCKAFAPVFEAAAEKHPDILFAKVNTDEQPRLAEDFEVRSIPTFLSAKSGTIVHVKMGAMAPALFEKMIEELRQAKIEEEPAL